VDAPFGQVTWVIDKILGWIGGRPRLRLFIRAEERPGSGFAFGGDKHWIAGPQSVVIRVVNVGRISVEVEHVGVELDGGAFVPISGGEQPEILPAPGHLERYCGRKMFASTVGQRRIKHIAAVGTDGHRYNTKPAREWQTPKTWPGGTTM
jgi:hypothetical protein